MIINPVVSGIQLPELVTPAGAGQILSGYQAINDDGEIITGNIQDITFPNPNISVSSSGLITASSTYSAGFTNEGTVSNTYQLSTQSAKTITPRTSSQTAVASGRYTTGAITVAGDSDLVAGNIRNGVNIFGVTGTYKGAEIGVEGRGTIRRNSSNEVELPNANYVIININRGNKVLTLNRGDVQEFRYNRKDVYMSLSSDGSRLYWSAGESSDSVGDTFTYTAYIDP